MVPEIAADERVAHDPAARDHEGAAELQRIAGDAPRPKTAPPGAGEAAGRGGTRAVEDVAAELRGVVADELGVDDDATDRSARLVEEGARLFEGTIADHYQLAASPPDLLLDAAQLRDLLAAEDSAEVPQEDQHRGAVLPQCAEPHRSAGEVDGLHRRQRVRDVERDLVGLAACCVGAQSRIALARGAARAAGQGSSPRTSPGVGKRPVSYFENTLVPSTVTSKIPFRPRINWISASGRAVLISASRPEARGR